MLPYGWGRPSHCVPFTDQFRGSFVLGLNCGKTAQAPDILNTLGQRFVNLIYAPIKNAELGGELVYGQRKTFAGDTGTMSRFDLMGRYSF